MATQDNSLELNSEGYLINFNTWNKEFAIAMAKEHDLVLTECHWRIIHFLRDYHAEFGVSPEPREIIKKLGHEIIGEIPCTRKHLESMFADGGCKLACKIAGLPDCHCRGL